MPRSRNWDVFGDVSPTEIHHEDCEDTPAYATGDATESAVLDAPEYAQDGETFDRSCECLDPILDEDRRDDAAQDGGQA